MITLGKEPIISKGAQPQQPQQPNPIDQKLQKLSMIFNLYVTEMNEAISMLMTDNKAKDAKIAELSKQQAS